MHLQTKKIGFQVLSLVLGYLYLLQHTTLNVVGFVVSPLRPTTFTILSSGDTTCHHTKPTTTATTTTLLLSSTKVTFDNFWMNTIGTFIPCETPARDPDFISPSGSKYWNLQPESPPQQKQQHNDIELDTTTTTTTTNTPVAAVIRQSDHWSGQHGCHRIVDCIWWYDASIPLESSCTVTGMCAYDDFRRPKRKGRKTLRQRGVVVMKEKDIQTKGLTTTTTTTRNITFANFWRSTQAAFESYDKTMLPSDREPDYVSKSGSMYWDDGDGVIRLSDHWTGQFGVTRIVDCRWTITVQQTHPKDVVAGKCLYQEFVMRLSSRQQRKPKTKSITWRKLSR